jgi:hypothetical protein
MRVLPETTTIKQNFVSTEADCIVRVIAWALSSSQILGAEKHCTGPLTEIAHVTRRCAETSSKHARQGSTHTL